MRIFADTAFDIDETVRVVIFAPVKTLSDPTFCVVTLAEVIFAVGVIIVVPEKEDPWKVPPVKAAPVNPVEAVIVVP